MLLLWHKPDNDGVVKTFCDFIERFNLDWLAGDDKRLFVIRKDGQENED